MGNITDTPAQGKATGGSSFRHVCPNNGYITEIYGKADDRIRQICGKCSDGAVLPCAGTDVGPAYVHKGPFEFISIRAGDWIDNIFDIGGNGGDARELRCPSGSKVIGLYGRSGAWLDQLGTVCGAPPAQPAVNAVVPTPQVLPPAPSTPVVQPDVVKPPYSGGPPIGPAYTAPPVLSTPADTSSGTDFDISKYYVWIFLIIVVIVGGMVWNKNRNNKLAAANNAVQLQNLQSQYPTSAPPPQYGQQPQWR